MAHLMDGTQEAAVVDGEEAEKPQDPVDGDFIFGEAAYGDKIPWN